jgi:hypothetical protein
MSTSKNPARLVLKNRFMPNPPNSKRVLRPSKWGNPHKCETQTPEARDKAAQAYEQDFMAGRIKWKGKTLTPKDALRELGGFNLVCSCPDDGHGCHGAFLLEIANKEGR